MCDADRARLAAGYAALFLATAAPVGEGSLFDAILVALIAGGLVIGWFWTRFATVNVAVQLRNGPRYAHKLDSLVEHAEFSTPLGRLAAVNRLSRMLDPDDVVDGFVGVHFKSSGREAAGGRAERIARSQMKRIGIEAHVVNVARPDGRATRAAVHAVEEAPADGEACILAIALTLRRRALRELRSGSLDEVRPALGALARIGERDLDALYFYYCPHTAEPLDAIAANRMFADLRAGRIT